jgi:hypothetical protein
MGRVRLDQGKVIATAHRQARPLVRRTSNLILQGAQRMAPRGDHMSGSGVRKRGQPLTQSLTTDTRTNVHSIVERVGSRNNYAATVHQGSTPHFIRGRGKMLKFEWERGNLLLAARTSGRLRGRGPSRRLRRRGNYFFFAQVHHPGNKRPVRFLTTPMHLYGRLLGFRTTSTPVSRSRLP